jgi:hypothetical protein
MNAPFFKLSQTQEVWQAVFAYQVFHRKHEEWMKMRWGFNAQALTDEALDRYKLFIESQTVNDIEFHTGTMQNNMLALRGIHSPELGLKMVLLGKSSAAGKDQARQSAEQYAREVFSTFPHDFILVPAETEGAYHNLSGEHLLIRDLNVAQIQRGILPLSTTQGHHHLVGLWQGSSRSNEQVWRALSAMPQPALFNVLIQPSFLFPTEKHALLEIKKGISDPKQGNETISNHIPWIKNYLERRLEIWKRFFLVQVHLVADGEMENLIRSIGSALTRPSDKLSLPGYLARYPTSADESRRWLENIRSLDLDEDSHHLNDLADTDEVFSIFRFPYRPELGLPGANFNEMDLSLG